MKWVVRETDRARSRQLAAELGISPLLAQLLVNRGLRDAVAARAFLRPRLETLHDYHLLPDLEPAVTRLCQALENRERIVVYGDYDVDGLTATTLLVEVLNRLGATVDYYIPDRFAEGYGLHCEAIGALRERGCDLLLTVDCGAAAVVEAELAASLGIDLVITDHHEVGEQLPQAVGVVNPKRKDSGYPFRELAGVGVAYKLAQGLWERWTGTSFPIQEYLDLVALGTVADVVPLVDENRILVKFGLEQLARTRRIGLRALLELTQLEGELLEAYHVGFVLAPRLNAAGRMDHALGALELLLTTDLHRARELAQHLDRINRQRQVDEARIVEEAEGMIQDRGLLKDRALVLASPNWSSGIVGIAASRLVERYHRPTILIALDEGLGKGSGRSIPGFDLYEALGACQGSLVGYGGHTMAAGLSVQEELWNRFAQEFVAYANHRLTPEDIVPRLEIDTLVDLDELDLALVDEVAALAPFGPGNPRPLFGCRDVTVQSYRRVGNGDAHLQLWVRQGDRQLACIGFRMGDREEVLTAQVDLAFRVAKNQWQGEVSLQGQLVDVRPSVLPQAYHRARQVYDGRACTNKAQYLAELLPWEGKITVYAGVVPATDEELALWQRAGFTLKEERTFTGEGGLVRLEHPAGTVRLVHSLYLGEEVLAKMGDGALGVWGMPLGYGELVRLLTLVPASRIYFLISDDQVNKTKELLPFLCPDRKTLGRAYRQLQPGCTLEEFTGFVRDELLGLKGIEPGKALTNLVVRGILEIFCDLGLLQQDGGYLSVSHPGRKLDLTSSIRYNENKFLVKTFHRFSRYVLTQPVEKILGDLNSLETGATRRVLGGSQINDQGGFGLPQGGR